VIDHDGGASMEQKKDGGASMEQKKQEGYF
jgi:hypothetical protein